MDVLLINDDVDALDKPEDVGVSTNLEFNQINKNNSLSPSQFRLQSKDPLSQGSFDHD